MKQTLKISLNNEEGECCSVVPSSLSKHIWPGAHYYGLEDSRIDVFCQQMRTERFSLQMILLNVREKLKVTIRQEMPMTFLMTNNGPDIRCAVGEMQCQNFGNNCFNVFYLPSFSVTLYPNPSKEHYELFLIEIDDLTSLLDIEAYKNDLFRHNMYRH